MSRAPSTAVEINGRYRLSHGIDAVWRELNNPLALEYAIGQCREMKRLGADRYEARLRVGIGPVRVPVTANLDVTPQSPPERYRLSCSMWLGPFGNAGGDAAVRLRQTESGVVLDYRARIDFSGRLAGYGARFFDDAVERNMRRFFDRFEDWMREHAGLVSGDEA